MGDLFYPLAKQSLDGSHSSLKMIDRHEEINGGELQVTDVGDAPLSYYYLGKVSEEIKLAYYITVGLVLLGLIALAAFLLLTAFYKNDQSGDDD